MEKTVAKSKAANITLISADARACCNCKYSELPNDTNQRICRRFPRQHTQLPHPSGNAMTISNYPMVMDDDWCWEFRRVENA